ncbi:MAG: hypothetical protein R6W89_00325, partial [Candidatus Hydrogenedentota bacterium]
MRSDIDLNTIYAGLLTEVYSREYEHQRHPSVRVLSEDEFVKILEQIGLVVWHGGGRGGGRTATMEAIQRSCEANPQLKRLLEQFEEDAETGVTSLLTGFYFRQHGKTEVGDKVFEFTHKSFGEYLAALRIVRAAERIADRVTAAENGDGDGWTEPRALAYWA